jgi:hypothetical protein
MALTQAEIAEHLDMSERNARDVLKALGIEWKDSTLDAVRVAYIRDLREKAAGRGGDDQFNLTQRRAEESAVKTAMMRLEYNQRIGELVPASDAALAISDWCSSANREYRSGINKLTSEIQSTLKVDIPSTLVETIVNPTIERIQSHARSIGEAIVAGVDGVHAAEATADSGVDQR